MVLSYYPDSLWERILVSMAIRRLSKWGDKRGPRLPRGGESDVVTGCWVRAWNGPQHLRVSGQPKWKLTENEIFSKKTAYILANQHNTQREMFNWKALWHFKGPTRGSLLLWLVAHNRLKARHMLWTRQILDSPACEICGENETTLHAIRGYRLPTNVWQLLLPQAQCTWLWTIQDTQTWIQRNLASTTETKIFSL